MLENTIFKNPVKWAEKLTGTNCRYAFTSIMNVLVGVTMIILFSRESKDIWIWLRNGALFTILNIEFPLYYLRALRTFVLLNKANETLTVL